MKRLGIWLWPQDVLERGAQTVWAHFECLGVTDVFLLTKGLAGKVCCHRAGSAAPILFPERDILEEAIDASHKLGMRIHAWVTSSNDAEYKLLHPEAGNAHLVRGRDNSVIRMADEGYCAYMEGFIAELSAAYEIDGLHLDYIRFNHLLNGWAEEDRQALRARGVDVMRVQQLVEDTFCGDSPDAEHIFGAYRAGDPDVLALARYRRDTVRAFAARLIAAARAKKPGLTASAALMPEGAYPDIAFSELHYGQNYEDAAELYDFVVPMSYHASFQKPPAWVAEVARGAIRRGNRVLAGVQAFGEGTAEEAAACLTAARKVDDPLLEGACLFRYGEPACDALIRACAPCGA